MRFLLTRQLVVRLVQFDPSNLSFISVFDSASLWFPLFSFLLFPRERGSQYIHILYTMKRSCPIVESTHCRGRTRCKRSYSRRGKKTPTAVFRRPMQVHGLGLVGWSMDHGFCRVLSMEQKAAKVESNRGLIGTRRGCCDLVPCQRPTCGTRQHRAHQHGPTALDQMHICPHHIPFLHSK